jgi:uncharacterized membrane protein YccC
VDNFFNALLGALMDPILLGSAVFAGLIPERWVRGVVAALLAMVISVLIVVSLGSAGVILPSDRPGLLFSGSIARWLVAWGIAEVVAFTWWRLKRRKKTAEIHPDLQEPSQRSRSQRRSPIL